MTTDYSLVLFDLDGTLLAELDGAGVKLAVVSNKFQEGTDYLIRKFFPAVPFSAILGNRPGFPLKPTLPSVRSVAELREAILGKFDCHCHILPGLDDGAAFQRNLGSVAGFYGGPVMERAKYLLEKGYYSFLGTDLHNRRYAEFFDVIKDKSVLTL